VRVLGLMSGTSIDAIDVAVVDIELEGGTLNTSLIGWTEEPWPHELRERIRGWSDPGAEVRLAELSAASMEIGAQFAVAAERGAAAAGVDLPHVDLVASHGQTVHHRVDEDGRAVGTLQLGEPAVIAERTGRTVVADFRPRDIAAGGQGAPLVSFVDALLFAEEQPAVGVLNLGGMANVTLIPAGAPFDAIAFDTGPGNALIDGCARQLLGQPTDGDGAAAAAGRPSEQLLDELMAQRYFERSPPKSTGRELFGDAFVARIIARATELRLGEHDVLATVTELTARSVARAIERWSPTAPRVVHVSGGGTRNRTLMRALERALAGEQSPRGERPQVQLVDEAGLPSAAKEAFSFAVLGHEALHGRANSIPGGTGARHPSVLGAIWPGSDYQRLLEIVAKSGRESEPVDRIVVHRSSPGGRQQRRGDPE
jgi:anhydro-N-acetylmuramic acid kinase